MNLEKSNAKVGALDADLEEHWQWTHGLGWGRRNLLVQEILPESFVRRHWHEFSMEERHCCLTHQQLPMGFLHDRWHEFTVTEQRTCCEKQKLSMEFLQRIWILMDSTHRLICARSQEFSSDFIEEHWDEMDWWWRAQCIDKQKRLPAKLVVKHLDELVASPHWQRFARRRKYDCSDISLGELPEYLSCELEGIRISAEERLRELGGGTQDGC